MSKTKAINIIFDGPPSHESGRFVEVETDDGKGIRAGEWIEKGNGLWALRITELPPDEQCACGNLLRSSRQKTCRLPLDHSGDCEFSEATE
jgi:hypothetical protein